jgi:hypothetical protein
LAHGDGCLYAAGDGVDTGGELQEVELLVLFADGVSGVDARNVVSLCGKESCYARTFSNFVFSACSSLPALRACRFSDLAVN